MFRVVFNIRPQVPLFQISRSQLIHKSSSRSSSSSSSSSSTIPSHSHSPAQPNDWSLYKQTGSTLFPNTVGAHLYFCFHVVPWWNHCHSQFFSESFQNACLQRPCVRAGEFSSWHRCGLIVSPTSGSTKRHAFSLKGNRGGMSWRNTSTMASSSYSG